jgi:hypothetical protein
MITVKVVNQSTGKPVSDKRVSLFFDGLFRSGSGDQYTDSQGEAHFDNDPGKGTVYLDGKNVKEGRLEGRVVIYI